MFADAFPAESSGDEIIPELLSGKVTVLCALLPGMDLHQITCA